MVADGSTIDGGRLMEHHHAAPSMVHHHQNFRKYYIKNIGQILAIFLIIFR